MFQAREPQESLWQSEFLITPRKAKLMRRMGGGVSERGSGAHRGGALRSAQRKPQSDGRDGRRGHDLGDEQPVWHRRQAFRLQALRRLARPGQGLRHAQRGQQQLSHCDLHGRHDDVRSRCHEQKGLRLQAVGQVSRLVQGHLVHHGQRQPGGFWCNANTMWVANDDVGSNPDDKIFAYSCRTVRTIRVWTWKSRPRPTTPRAVSGPTAPRCSSPTAPIARSTPTAVEQHNGQNPGTGGGKGIQQQVRDGRHRQIHPETCQSNHRGTGRFRNTQNPPQDSIHGAHPGGTSLVGGAVAGSDRPNAAGLFP